MIYSENFKTIQLMFWWSENTSHTQCFRDLNHLVDNICWSADCRLECENTRARGAGMIKKKNQMRLLVSGFFRAIKIYTWLSFKKNCRFPKLILFNNHDEPDCNTKQIWISNKALQSLHSIVTILWWAFETGPWILTYSYHK